MILGVVADDFTGASDIACTLAKEGLAVAWLDGAPPEPADPTLDAAVVALKSRTAPVAEACAQSLGALAWLRAGGCRQIVSKVCSTFDSTDAGNIGPVAEALADALGAAVVPVCPAFPATGRTVYRGHLFVGDRLLSESGMERHPLTPMTDPDLRRVLARQARGPVGHVAWPTVAQGGAAIRAALDAEAAAGRRLVIVDAIADADLRALGAAAEGLPLLVGGSGVALGLPAAFARAGLVGGGAPAWVGVSGPALAVAGSVSAATRAQVAAHLAAGRPARAVSPEGALSGRDEAVALADWALAAAASGATPLVYSTDAPEAVAAAQAAHGRDAVAAALERLLAEVAAAAVARGVGRLVTAGGATTGAILRRLGLGALTIGPEIDPGVPALAARIEGRPLALALKSGNFGAVDFFEKAARMLAAPA